MNSRTGNGEINDNSDATIDQLKQEIRSVEERLRKRQLNAQVDAKIDAMMKVNNEEIRKNEERKFEEMIEDAIKKNKEMKEEL